LKRIAVVATHPIQYQTPLYRYLTDRGLPLHVFFLSRHGLEVSRDQSFGLDFSWDLPLLEGFSYEFLPALVGAGGSPAGFWSLTNRRLMSRITRKNFSAVWVHGYRYASMAAVIVLATGRKLPILYRAETNRITSPPGSKARDVLTKALKKSSIRCLSIGSLNDEFYESIGIPPERRFLMPYSVDNERFQLSSVGLDKATVRRRYGLGQDALVVLFVGKLVPWKRPDLLLNAVHALRRKDVQLLFVGDGSMRDSLTTLSREKSVDARFAGFLNQSEIGATYAAADVFVLPSAHEPWGLVVNEAMNFGLPIIVSDRVGCGPDLVAHHGSGLVFESDSIEDLAGCLAVVLSDEGLRQEMSQASRRRISAWGFKECEAGLRAALE
jgi:glycosyltransferase involved in cell wall biosynthesis